MAAGPKKKYTIQIIKVGIGDPLITVTFKFIGDDPSSDNPEEYPVENLNTIVDVQYDSNAHNGTISRQAGNITMATFGTLNDYYLTFPFDQPEDFTVGNSMWFRFTASGVDNEGTSYSVNFKNSPGTAVSLREGFSYHPSGVEFATLSTRFTYCPGGDCIEL